MPLYAAIVWWKKTACSAIWRHWDNCRLPKPGEEQQVTWLRKSLEKFFLAENLLRTLSKSSKVKTKNHLWPASPGFLTKIHFHLKFYKCAGVISDIRELLFFCPFLSTHTVYGILCKNWYHILVSSSAPYVCIIMYRGILWAWPQYIY